MVGSLQVFNYLLPEWMNISGITFPIKCRFDFSYLKKQKERRYSVPRVKRNKKKMKKGRKKGTQKEKLLTKRKNTKYIVGEDISGKRGPEL